MQKITFVTGNPHKLHEAQYYLGEWDIQSRDIDLPEIQSVSVTDVTRHKIHSAHQTISQPCFVLDSSLIIAGLCDQRSEYPAFPGALIKDVFAHMGADNICEIVRSNQNYGATWSAVIGYHDGVRMYFFESHLSGRIAPYPLGDQGYHWDTIFIPDGSDLTFAQMSFEEKQSYALTPHLYRQFREFLAMAGE